MENETNFFDMDRIPVQLTYNFTEPPTVITFFCKIALADDDRDARQKFYSQTEGEQAAGLHAYYVDLLSRIAVDVPAGLPGFAEHLTASSVRPVEVERGERVTWEGDIKAALSSFLSDPSPMKVKVVADAIEIYNRISAPAEFFR